MRLGFSLVVVSGLACGGLADTAPEAPPPLPAPLDLPSLPPLPVPSSTRLPADPFEEVNGFLAVAGGEAFGPPAGLVVPGSEGWEHVAAGTTFAALSADGETTVVYDGLRPADWGCAAEPLPTFHGEAPFRGVVWISTIAVEADRVVRPTPSRAPTADRRLYSLPGGAELDVQGGRSIIERGGARPWAEVYGSGVDLRRDAARGPAYPELAFTVRERLFVVVRTVRDTGPTLRLLDLGLRSGAVRGEVSLPGDCPG